MTTKATDIKKRMQRTKGVKPGPSDYLSTGSTCLNLACTGNPFLGLLKGHYYFFVGDSQSGKTWFTLTFFAEAAMNKSFDSYRFIHDDVEGGALMDIARYFGERTLKRLEPPRQDKHGPQSSRTIEEFYDNVDDAINAKTPFIYILDSMDGLDSMPSMDKFQSNKKARRTGKETTGSFGDGKANINSQNIRRVVSALPDTGSILIIINQTRDNLGFGFKKKTKSGGHSLDFYACMTFWSSIFKKIKPNIKGKTREIGRVCKIEVTKNRIAGKDRVVYVPIYPSIGIDDIGGCVDYLVDEKHWKVMKGGIIVAKELRIKGRRESIVHAVERRGLQKDLCEIVAEVWAEIENACAIRRSNKYA